MNRNWWCILIAHNYVVRSELVYDEDWNAEEVQYLECTRCGRVESYETQENR